MVDPIGPLGQAGLAGLKVAVQELRAAPPVGTGHSRQQHECRRLL